MKTAVITGASKGLGLAIANEFVSKGWKVIGTGRSARPHELNSAVDYYQFDASDIINAETFWQDIQKQHSEAEFCLVNNAGGYASGGLLTTKPEDFEKQMKINYFTTVYMTRGLAKVIPKAKIINIISANALSPGSTDEAYGASKAATKQFFQSLQKEFKSSQYQITNLYPNNIATSGPNPAAIDPSDLAIFVRELADSQKSYYLRDVTLYNS